MKHYAIEFGSSRFDYYLGHHCLTSMAAHLATVPADQTIIISDSALSESYGQRLRDALNQKMPCQSAQGSIQPPITGAIAGAMPKIMVTWLINRCASSPS